MVIDDRSLSLADIAEQIRTQQPVALSEPARLAIRRGRDFLVQMIDGNDRVVYGVNTGFGYLCDKVIEPNDLEKLQVNLIRSHACGLGSEVPVEIVRLMLLLKVISLSKGHSGVKLETVERLLEFYHRDWLPVIYTQGSLGASGDLAPLAHLSLPLIGEGEFWVKGEKRKAAAVLAEAGLEPLTLGAKEGLALLNGTQFMLAYGVHVALWAEHLADLADQVAALSLDGFDGLLEPFSEEIHAVRPHPGQIDTAARIRQLLVDSEIALGSKTHVQDPYSFRCIPQVHGASKDALRYVRQVLEIELNSVSDNPLVFPEQGKVLSGGNFHGQPLALSLDFLAIAVAELASISERRTYQLLSGQRGLPLFLVANPGLNSGLMIPQYTAASIVSQNKQLCTPASVDTIPSSNNQEDHVSMGANAATKCYQVLQNLHHVLAIELLNASQALHFRSQKRTGSALWPLLHGFREVVPFVEEDRMLADDIHTAVSYLSGLRSGSARGERFRPTAHE
ncbi:MAG: histidine ammonia-lyase [Bacteroidia bacterium]|nr:histidine ammonia-lyase [Bacteroidia bacterium]